MNWTMPTLLNDALNAWSADNWPYTLGFWVIVGGFGWSAARLMRWYDKRDKRTPPD